MADQSTPVQIGSGMQNAQPVFIVGGGGGGGGGGDVTVTNWPATQAVSGPVTNTQLRATPIPTVEHQGNIISGPLALTAGTATTAIAAFADRRGMRILNYIEAPVYLAYGVTGTPTSGAGSDYVPAAVGGVPGQWECPFAPVGGVRAVCSVAGSITVTVW